VQKRHPRTLAALFRHPIATDVAWRDVMSLVMALGGEVRSRSGAERAVSLRGRDLVVHEPCSSGLAPRSLVLRMRRRGARADAGAWPLHPDVVMRPRRAARLGAFAVLPARPATLAVLPARSRGQVATRASACARCRS